MAMIAASWQVLLELSPWLLGGTLLACLLHIWLPPGLISRRLRGSGGVLSAVAVGVPLPLCSCGVIPAGIGLKRDGASDGASIGFLISTPQTGVDSVLISAGMLGWPFALFKVLCAVVTGVVGGLLAEWSSGDKTSPASPPPGESLPRPTYADGLQHGVEILRSVWRWLVIGIVASAAIETLVPAEWIQDAASAGGPLAAALLALLISLPLYVCAISSVPIAAALVAKGLPAGAALVFLMAGPATNVATVGAILRAFGRRVLLIYLGTIVAGSVLFALLFDWIAPGQLVLRAVTEHRHTSWWSVFSAIVLLAIFLWFAYQDVSRYWRRRRAGDIAADGHHVAIEGMTCDGCADRLETGLRSTPGVQRVEVRFRTRDAVVEGPIEIESLRQRIGEIGFRVGEPQAPSEASGRDANTEQ